MINKEISIIKIKKKQFKKYNKQIVNIHSNAFKNFYLTSLGKPFLNEFYNSILNHNNGFIIGLIFQNRLVAFAAGTSCEQNFFSDIFKKNFFSLALSCMPALFKNPLKIFSVLEHLINVKSNKEKRTNASLLSICVDPSFPNMGFGQIILKEFENELFKVNDRITLTTDALNNQYVNNFYIKNDYLLHSEFFQGKRKMNLYIKKFHK
jgi:ribosomal protein S18 acetylase RimI-like enzyme